MLVYLLAIFCLIGAVICVIGAVAFLAKDKIPVASRPPVVCRDGFTLSATGYPRFEPICVPGYRP